MELICPKPLFRANISIILKTFGTAMELNTKAVEMVYCIA